jgi:hypothetical protein
MTKRRSASRAAADAKRSAVAAFKVHEALGAAANVIAARTELAALAVANPTAEAGRELNLMVTEKVAAFSKAGAEVVAGAQAMAGHGARYAADEATAAGKGLARLSACRSPAEMALVQGELMADFVSRSLSFGFGLNSLAVRTGSRALSPVHKAVTANERRLNKSR